MEPKNSYTFELAAEQQAALITLLRDGNYRPAIIPHTLIAADTEECRIALYKSGKCLVQGKGAYDFVVFVLEPVVLKTARLGYEDILDPELGTPHIGVDESGKGDFFGPLVTAGAYVDQSLLDPMRDIGVRDSKTISSDRVALELADKIQKMLGNRFSLVAIGPARYNSLYAKIRNVNSILAWAHARCIENLLAIVPHCRRAISDQFGSKSQVSRALMQRGKKIELVQRHRAESDLAVAAASILARAGFLRALLKMGGETNTKFPKGASPAVIETGCALVKAQGPQTLLKTSKCHFKTTDTILSQCGFARDSLGPDGAATSKPLGHRRFPKKPEPVETDESES